MKIQFILILLLLFALSGCGKVGPLVLPEEKLDKSIITFPCGEECMEKFEAEKLRQQSVTVQTN